MTMRFEILTIFPEMLRGFFDFGVVSRAQKTGLVEIAVHDLRTFTHDRHRTVDDRPFGGGEGMVLKPEPLGEALASSGMPQLSERSTESRQREAVILLSAQGQRFTQSIVRELVSLDRIVLLCGRYEGVDERVNEIYCDRELSIGDYVLSGGELAAAVVLDAVARLIPGVPSMSMWKAFRVPSTAPAGCSTIRITRGQRSFAAWPFPKSCSAAIMRPCASGAASSSCAKRSKTALTCWKAQLSATKTGASSLASGNHPRKPVRLCKSDEADHAS